MSGIAVFAAFGAMMLLVSVLFGRSQRDGLRHHVAKLLGPGVPDSTLKILAVAVLLVLPASIWAAISIDIRPWIAVPLGITVTGLMVVLADQQRGDFQAKARTELSDLLDIVARGMRVGMSFEQTLAIAADGRRGPVARTFRAIDRDTALGRPLPQALAYHSARLGLPDFTAFASLVSLQQETGGSLASRISMLVAAIAERRELETRFRLAVMQIRVQANILAMFLVFLTVQTVLTSRGNAMFLIYDEVGRQMLAGSFCLTALGWLVIWALVRFSL
jgi:tight adherence protein B